MRSILNNIRVSIYNVAFPMDHVHVIGIIIKPLGQGSYPSVSTRHQRKVSEMSSVSCHPRLVSTRILPLAMIPRYLVEKYLGRERINRSDSHPHGKFKLTSSSLIVCSALTDFCAPRSARGELFWGRVSPEQSGMIAEMRSRPVV